MEEQSNQDKLDTCIVERRPFRVLRCRITDERFGFKIPCDLRWSAIRKTQPRSTWSDVNRYDNVANLLVQMFNENLRAYRRPQ